MSDNIYRKNQARKSKPKEKEHLTIPISTKSITLFVTIFSAAISIAIYITKNISEINNQDDRHSMQREILILQQSIVEQKREYEKKENELYQEIYTLRKENLELKTNKK